MKSEAEDCLGFTGPALYAATAQCVYIFLLSPTYKINKLSYIHSIS